MLYDDFEIEISSDGEGGYRVITRPQRSRESLHLPFDALYAAKRFANEREHRRDAFAEGGLSETVGVPLFNAVFHGNVAGRLRQHITNLTQHSEPAEERGVRLRLIFGQPTEGPLAQDDLFREDYVRLASLPWEAMVDPTTGTALALSPDTPIVRTLDRILPGRGVAKRLPLKVLMVTCLPTGYPGRRFSHLDLEREKEEVRRALDNPDILEIEFLDDPTPEAMATRLREGGFHILHWSGHGGFDSETTNRGYLWFRDVDRPENDDAFHVWGAELAQLLVSCRQLGLVFLNACRTGQLPYEPGQNPFQAVAAALSLAGVPSVIAMQHVISDGAAIELAREFYDHLGSGRVAVDEALAVGRQAIQRGSVEWATPVLFLSGDGLLFPLAGVSSELPDGEPAPLLLGIRSFNGWNRLASAERDRVLTLWRHFDKEPKEDPHRFLLPGRSWNQHVYRPLQKFLRNADAERRPLDLLFAAHQTIAFATGYVLEAKGGTRLTICQPTIGRGTVRQSALEGEVPAGPLWSEEDEFAGNSDSADIALVVSLTGETWPAAKRYLEANGPRVGTVLTARIASQPDQEAVVGGAHAWALAKSLVRRLEAREAERTTIHLFAKAPNAFLVFLGQLWGSLGRVQLYEYDFKNTRHGTYEPSLLLPG